ncbi:MAG: hypothetical protein A2V86_11155 [Deltaproteobacteria bacterium RBG_16_49_23]|nr:MAG: hypothetical protein A2V86_11155 [Deltaproteobacteria bacterium RBG_16_49_23]
MKLINSRVRVKGLLRHASIFSMILLILIFLCGRAFAVTNLADLNVKSPAVVAAELMPGAIIDPASVKFTGQNIAAGTFTSGLNDGIGIDQGILLTTGAILNAVGPNFVGNLGVKADLPGDPQLDAIVAPALTFDAAVLEFDFTLPDPANNVITFKMVFASDEYSENVGKSNGSGNDIFGLFLNGVNIALIPESGDPVTVNTLNRIVNPGLFINNDPELLGLPTPFETQYDGFSKVITFSVTVDPSVPHHLKLAIADTRDRTIDSAVFLAPAALGSGDLSPQPEISVSPMSKDFPTVNVGSASSQLITISNNGIGDLKVASVEFIGGNGMFILSPEGPSPCPNLTPTVGIGGYCTMIIDFSPLSEGAWSAILRINSNDALTPTDITLTGVGAIQPVFADSPETSWAEDYINTLFYNDLTKGCSASPLLFCPDDGVTREQMAAFIIRAMEGDPTATCEATPFPDVSVFDTFSMHIERLKARGITLGYADGTYIPGNFITREEMAAFIVRAVEGGQFFEGPCAGPSPFLDVLASNPFCKNIERLKALNVTLGCGGGNYCPNGYVLREQMAAFIARGFLGIP